MKMLCARFLASVITLVGVCILCCSAPAAAQDMGDIGQA